MTSEEPFRSWEAECIGLPSVAVGAGRSKANRLAWIFPSVPALVAGRKPFFKARTGPRRETCAEIWPGALYEFLAEDQQVIPKRELGV